MIKRLNKASRSPDSARIKRRPKGWSVERRARQAALIRSWRPWQKSTGPRTNEGKAHSARNALKHGWRSRACIERRRADREIVRASIRTLAIARAFLRTLSAQQPSACEVRNPSLFLPIYTGDPCRDFVRGAEHDFVRGGGGIVGPPRTCAWQGNRTIKPTWLP